MSIDMLARICKDASDIEVKVRDAPLGKQLGIVFGVHEITRPSLPPPPRTSSSLFLNVLHQNKGLYNFYIKGQGPKARRCFCLD